MADGFGPGGRTISGKICYHAVRTAKNASAALPRRNAGINSQPDLKPLTPPAGLNANPHQSR